MKIINKSSAGTMESNDALVILEPIEGKTRIDLASPVQEQYGAQILSAINDVVGAFGIENALVIVRDHGALDCTIKARVETAIRRSLEGGK